jgi:hypothetical protein
LENNKQRSLIIFFLFLLLLINFLWINKEVKNIFSLDQSIYIAFIISTIALIIFSGILIFIKRKKENIGKIFSENEYTIIENDGNIIAIKGLEIQELKDDQKNNIHDKFQTFISTLVKNKVPCIYTLSIMPLGGIKNLLSNEEIGSRIWLITFGRSNEENKSIEEMERNFIIMESALQTAFPKIYTKKIEEEDLRNFFEIFFIKKNF